MRQGLKLKERTRMREALALFNANRTILEEWGRAMRRHSRTSHKLLRNLLKDCHCQGSAFQGLLKVSHATKVKGLLSAGDWNRLREKFEGLCSKYRFKGEPIKNDNWGEKCYRVVWLRYFADFLREEIADSLRKQFEDRIEYPQLGKLGSLGDSFMLRARTLPAITTDEQAIRFMEELMAIPIDDRVSILSLVNLSKREVVWVSSANQIRDAFVSENKDHVKDVILCLGKTYLGIKALLFQYSVAAIFQKNLQLHFPTPFDVGWDQGNFVPSKPEYTTGWTVPLSPMTTGLPEGVHVNSDCSLVEPSLIFF